MKIYTFLLLLLICVPVVLGLEGNVRLLAVSELGEKVSGNVADLSLEIREGRGRVFLETFPLTKVDTQISMRFAQQIACNFLDRDCSDLDFIYTIRAPAGIIGGPSAGASAAVLTSLLLSEEEYNKDLAVTGTINSGGLIGAVGGIKEKIEAAGEGNITIVLIPRGKRFLEEDNETKIDLVAYGETLGVVVKEVSTLDEVISAYTGKIFEKKEFPLEVSLDYQNIMRYIAHDLCTRSDQFESPKGKIDDFLLNLLNDSRKYREESVILLQDEQYYSAASFCFRSNINNGYVSLYLQNLSEDEIVERLTKLEKGANEFNKRLDNKKLENIPDLQTYMIVKQRVLETLQHVEQGYEELNSSEIAYILSLANERLFSASAWSNFFKSRGKPFALDVDSLRNSCETKIREAEERLQYVLLFIPNGLGSVRRGIEQAHEDFDKGDYGLCLFRASKAKAEANVVISAIGADEELLGEIFKEKMLVARDTIAKSSTKGMFPIVGYSYYEYAKTLEESDINLGLLFAEYALELSSLDLYFKEPSGFQMEKRGILLFAILILLGIIAYMLKPKKQS